MFTISEYAAGYILGPLVIAPLSELYGRLPVVHATNCLFLIFNIACAVSTSIPMFIIFRFGQAMYVCGGGTLGPGFIADLMPVEKRGLAMTIFAVDPTVGPSLSPTIGGILSEKVGWRWVFWFISILTSVLTISTFFVLKETYTPVLLAKKQAKANTALGNTPTKTPTSAIRAAVIRLLKLLTRSQVMLILALQSSIALSYLNLILSTFSLTFQKEYHFSTWSSGFTLFGLGLGFIIGQIAVGAFSDRYLLYKKSQRVRVNPNKQDSKTLPEDRLPPLILGSLLIPLGFFWVGWSIETHTHWIVPIIGSVWVSIGAMFVFLPVSMYLVDCYTKYAVSATAGNLVVRSIISAALPLVAEPLYQKVGYGWGDSVFAFVALSFLPVPFLLVRYGGWLGMHPRFQAEL